MNRINRNTVIIFIIACCSLGSYLYLSFVRPVQVASGTNMHQVNPVDKFDSDQDTKKIVLPEIEYLIRIFDAAKRFIPAAS